MTAERDGFYPKHQHTARKTAEKEKKLRSYAVFSRKFENREKQPEPYDFLEKCNSLWGRLTPAKMSNDIVRYYRKGIRKQVVCFFGLPGARKTSSATVLYEYLIANKLAPEDITSVTIDAAFKKIDTNGRGPGTYNQEDFNNATDRFDEMIDETMQDPQSKVISIEAPVVTGVQAADYLARKKREMLLKRRNPRISEEVITEEFSGFNRGITAINHMFGAKDETSENPRRRAGGKYREQIAGDEQHVTIPFYAVGLVAGDLDNLLSWREHPQLDKQGNIMPGSTALGTKVANEEVRMLLEENEFILKEAEIPALYLRLYMVDRYRLQVNAAVMQWYLKNYLKFPEESGFIAVSHLPLKKADV